MFSGDVTRVDLPGQVAPFSVLEGHADLVSLLSEGVITYYMPNRGKASMVKIQEGVAKVAAGHVHAWVRLQDDEKA